MRYEKSDSLSRYFKSIKDLNPLTKEEELELAIKSKTGDRKAINKLIEHNLKIVITIANKNIGRGIEVDDLIQQGNIGLYEAALRYDPSHNVRFASFASTRILKMMNQLIDECGRLVKIPVNQEYARYLAKKEGKEVSNLNSVRLDDMAFDDSDKSKIDNGIISVVPEVYEEFDIEYTKVKTNYLLSKLKDRDRNIVKLYFGIDCDEELTSVEIAEEVGLTQVRVCQIINSAKKQFQKLKK